MRWIDRAIKLAKSKGHSQRALTDLLGMSRQNANNWKKGGTLSLMQAIRIARFLDVTVDSLIGEEEGGPTVKESSGRLTEADWADVRRLVDILGLSARDVVTRLSAGGPGGGKEFEVMKEEDLGLNRHLPGNKNAPKFGNPPGRGK